MVGAIIPARMTSRRLPGKVLMPLGNKSMLEWVVSAVLQSKVERAVVLITPDPQDDAIMDLCNKLDIDIFVGSNSRDVLGDFHTISTKFGFDPIVRVTADCPLVSPHLIDCVIEEYSKGCDYCATGSSMELRTFPRGVEADVVSYAVLRWMSENLTPELTPYGRYSDDYRKHVTLYIRENPHAFTVRNVVLDMNKLRLTVDTPEEYNKINELFTQMGDNPSWLKAVDIIEHNPELAVMETPDSQTKAKWRVW